MTAHNMDSQSGAVLANKCAIEHIKGYQHATLVSLLRDLFDHVCCLPMDRERHNLIQSVSQHLGEAPQFHASTDPVYTGRKRSQHGYELVEAALDGNRLDLHFPDPYVPGEELAHRQDKLKSVHQAEFLSIADTPLTLELEASPMSNATEAEQGETLKVVRTVIEHLKKTATVPMTKHIYRSAQQQIDEMDHFGPQEDNKPPMRGQIITPAGVLLVDVQLIGNTLSIQFGKEPQAQGNLWVIERQKRAHKGRLLRQIGKRCVLTLIKNREDSLSSEEAQQAKPEIEDLGY